MVLKWRCFSNKKKIRKVMLITLRVRIYFENRPFNKDNTKRTIKIQNRILAIDAAPAAIPPNPNTAATIATIKKVIVQRNIFFGFSNYS